VAGDDDDDDAKEEAFDYSNDEVGKIGEDVDVVVPISGGDAEDVGANEVGGEDPEGGGLSGEKGKGDDHGKKAWGDEVVDGVDGHGAEGVDLFADFHGADFCGHGGADAAREHHGGDDGAELTKHGDGDESASASFEVEKLELEEGLGGENGTGEGAGDDDDGLGAPANFGHLLGELVPAFLASKEGVDDFAKEVAELAKIGEEGEEASSELLDDDHVVALF